MGKRLEFVLRYRYLIVVLVLVITGILGYQIKNLEVNSDVIDSLPEKDPHAMMLKDIGSRFGGNRVGIVIIEAVDVFQTDVLYHIRQMTDSISNIGHISSVTSITNIIDIRGDDFGIEVGKLVDDYELPETPGELEILKSRVMEKDLYKGSIISADGTTALVIFVLQEDADIQNVARLVEQKAGSLGLPEQIYFTGTPMLITSIADLISIDMARLIPITFIVIGLVLFLGFKSVPGVVLPLLTSGIAIVWTIGLMAMGGFSMSMVSSNIPILLLAVGSAYSIHVINRIIQEMDLGYKKAVLLALGYIFTPVLLAAITTAVGFASFTFGAYLDMIRDYGLFTAVGTLLSCVLSLVFVPAVISLFTPKKKTDKEIIRSSFLSDRILVPLRKLLFRYPRHILVVWFVLILLSAGGIFLIQREVDIKDYFKKGNPTRIAEEIMTEKFGGTKPVFVRFEGDMQDPELLQTMIEMEAYMQASPDIATTQSVADLIVQINGILGDGMQIPQERDKIEQLWFLLDGNEYLDRFISEDLDEGIIISRFLSPDNQSKIVFAEYMEKFIQAKSTDSAKITITGMPYVDVTMDQSLVKSQIGSLSIAVVGVLIIVGFILKSFKSGFLATVPIVSGIIILFGVMGFTGIPLNIGTVLVASVALGIGIDYAIHIISHFNHEYRAGTEVAGAVEKAITISGKAILINVASVSAGFLILLFSEMVPLQYFGLLVAISMVGSSLGALTLLPVLLILTNRKRQVVVS